MNHDVIHDRYGRLYHLPSELSLIGHDIYGFCLSYQNLRPTISTHREKSSESGMLYWNSLPAGLIGSKIPYYLYKLRNMVHSIRPDVILGGSDALHAIFTHWIARKTQTPYFIDLYDNFESFSLSKIPGITIGYRKSLHDAQGITTVSGALQCHIQALFPDKPVLTIESTIKPEEFRSHPKNIARKLLNLPAKGILIGTAGSLASNRDTKTLYTAFENIYLKMPEAYLVLAGPLFGNQPPEHSHIIYLGELPHHQVAALYSALDLAVICMKDNTFGRFAFPQKAYEILTCKIPVVAAKVGALKDLFSRHQNCLYEPGNSENLEAMIISQLKDDAPPILPIPSWHEQAMKLDNFLKLNL